MDACFVTRRNTSLLSRRRQQDGGGGQVEWMNRTLNEINFRRYDQTLYQPRVHPQAFLNGSEFAKRLKTPKGLAVFEFISEKWASKPHQFNRDPGQHMPVLHR